MFARVVVDAMANSHSRRGSLIHEALDPVAQRLPCLRESMP